MSKKAIERNNENAERQGVYDKIVIIICTYNEPSKVRRAWLESDDVNRV